jgi:hypothetical protein
MLIDMENKQYFIYHIFNKKIGVTSNVERRMMQQKIYDNNSYEILETHLCPETAAYRERELQIAYGYKVDRNLFTQTLINQSKVDRKALASTIDWKSAKAKVDWSTVLKEHRSHKIDYDNISRKRKETTKDYDWNKILTEKRTPKIDYNSIAAKKYKKINQYDLNHKFIKTWDSITKAKEAMGNKKDRTINQCLSPNHQRQTAFNYIWKFTN